MVEPPICLSQDRTKSEIVALETDTSGKSSGAAVDGKCKEKAPDVKTEIPI